MGPRTLYDELESTQSTAIDRAREGAEPFTRIVAREQSRGRGRLDHAWSSPPGNLYLSVILPEPARALSLFPLSVGAELAFGLAGRYPIAPLVKWPNDLLVRLGSGRLGKLGGVLVDRVVDGSEVARLVIGIGLNVDAARGAFAPELRTRVAVLADLVEPAPALDEVEEVAVDAVALAAGLFHTSEGVDRAAARCRRALYGVGNRLLLDGRPAGILRALGDDGALWVEDEEATFAIRAGDVEVVEAT